MNCTQTPPFRGRLGGSRWVPRSCTNTAARRKQQDRVLQHDERPRQKTSPDVTCVADYRSSLACSRGSMWCLRRLLSETGDAFSQKHILHANPYSEHLTSKVPWWALKHSTFSNVEDLSVHWITARMARKNRMTDTLRNTRQTGKTTHLRKLQKVNR